MTLAGEQQQFKLSCIVMTTESDQNFSPGTQLMYGAGKMPNTKGEAVGQAGNQEFFKVYPSCKGGGKYVKSSLAITRASWPREGRVAKIALHSNPCYLCDVRLGRDLQLRRRQARVVVNPPISCLWPAEEHCHLLVLDTLPCDGDCQTFQSLVPTL